MSAFPSSPSDGEEFTLGSRTFAYNAASGFWRVSKASSSGSIVQSSGGAQVVSSTAQFDRDPAIGKIVYSQEDSSLFVFDGSEYANPVTGAKVSILLNMYETDATFTVSANTLDIGISADDMHFKEDGTKLYALGNAGGIRQYTLSTAWDLSTATQDSLSSFSWTHPNQYPQGIALSADGYTAVILDEGSGGKVLQYDLSTPFDMNTATYNTTIGERNFSLGHIGSSNSESGGARWYDSGNILSLHGRSRSVVSTVDCSANPYTINGATLIESTMMRDYDSGSYGSAAGIWSRDGLILDLLGGSFVDTQAKRLTCTTAFRASTADTANITSWNLPAGGGTGSENGFTVSPDYTMLFLSSGNTIKRIDIA